MNSSTRLALLVALLAARTALALEPERHITELAHRYWGSKDGAPTSVRSMAQTTDGFLWFGGDHGLYRFDGTLFQSFLTGPQLPSLQIRSLFASPDGALWIGYWQGGVSVLQRGRLTNYSSAEGFPEGFVNGFARDRSGRIWAASSGGLARFDGGRWLTVGKDSNYPGVGAQAIFVDHLGVLWVAGDHHIAVLSPGSSKFELTDEPYNGQIYSLAESPDGTVWMAETTRAVRPLLRPGQATSSYGLTRDDCQSRFPDTWQTEPRCRRHDDLEVRVGSVAILFDRDGNFWITSIGDGLRRAPRPLQVPKEPIGEFSDAVEHFTSKDGLSGDYVRAILEDREGTIWVSTRNGIDQFRNTDLAAVTLGSDIGPLSIAAADGRYVLALSTNKGLFRLRSGQDKTQVKIPEIGDPYYLYRDPLGSIWVTTISGVACRLAGRRCADRITFPAPKPGLPDARRYRPQIAMDARTRLWTYVGGLFVYQHGRWNEVPSGLSAQAGLAPETQFSDASGQIWYGFRDSQLLAVNDGQVRAYSPDDGLTVGNVESIYSNGPHLWVGGERGLARFDGSRFTAVLPFDSPAFNAVTGVVEADDGSLWLSELRGIVHISAAEVDRVLASAAHRAHYDLLNSLDGLPGETAHVPLPTAIRGTDGRLWFTASGGVAWVDPRRLYRNKLPPPVAIQSVVADGLSLAPGASPELPGTTTNLQIAYAGLSLSVPERVQFSYLLRGFDREWQNVGTRRVAYYAHLPPGSYDFQVRASNDAGVWNEVGASLRIRIIPAWYQAWWFYALCAVLVVAAVAALYRMRLAQVRADTRRLFEARLTERERIARELHDTLLQSFQGSLLRFQTVVELLPTRPTEAKRIAVSAVDGAAQAITEGRSAVAGLHASAAESTDLAGELRTLGERAANETNCEGVGLTIDVEGTPRALKPIVRDEIYRIAGEALRNSFRHAEARQIEVKFFYEARQLRLGIRDDGKGIDPAFLKAEGRTGHFGLHGMRERARLIGGKLTVRTAAGSGAEIELVIPAARAYTASRRRWWLAGMVSAKSVESES